MCIVLGDPELSMLKLHMKSLPDSRYVYVCKFACIGA